jgi:ethanolamine utilization microcompartment shell protein EutS
MRSKLFKKFVSSLVIACLLFSSYGVALAATASVKSDIKGHWAEAQISAWMDKGFITGYEDGSFKPGNQITRAEFIALINRSFGFTEETAISFSDVLAGNWAYPEVAKAVKAGYITGYADGTIGASKPISRQEVAAIVDRLLGLSTTENAATAFTDSSSIALWAKGSVEAAVAKGILKGYAADNSFKPGKSITRAEAVVTLDRAVAAKVTAYNTAGTYGPVTGTQTINGDVAIHAAGVTLQNLEINGKLLFAAGIGSGDAFLSNVTVKGDTTVNGGGVNSLHFKNSTLAKVIINAAAPVRVVAEGSTTVNQVDVSSPVVIQEDGATGTGFSDVTLNKDLPAGSEVSLKGTFDNVTILGDKANVELPEGTTINMFKTDTDTTVTGKGTIATAELGKDSKTSFETKPTATTTDGVATPPPVVFTAPAQKGTVTGSVYKYPENASNSNILRSRDPQPEPLVSVTVSVYSGNLGSGNIVSTVESDANGEYSISNVPVGNYYLKFVQEGYMDLTVTPTNHIVTVNATTDASRAFMYHNLVKGILKDSSGKPISNFSLELYDDEYTNYYEYTDTASDGSFYFYNVPANNGIYLYIENNGSTFYFEADDVSVEPVSAYGETDMGTIELIDDRLKTLSLSGITLDPVFSSDNRYYSTRVPNNVITTTVSATTLDPNAIIIAEDLGDKDLEEGNNYIHVNITPNKGYGNANYMVHVYRETAEQAEAIAIIEAYTEEDINFTFVQILNTATGAGSALNDNEGPYKAAVIAAALGALDTSGEIVALINYVNHREEKRLSDLQLSGITLSPSFNSDQRSYTASVPYNVTSTTVSATPINANVTYNPGDLGPKELVVGNNNIQVYVHPESGFYYRTYNVNVYRESAEQAEAIAAIEAGAGVDVMNVVAVLNLAKANHSVTVYEFSSDYWDAVTDANDGDLDTSEEIAALIENVNNNFLA